MSVPLRRHCRRPVRGPVQQAAPGTPRRMCRAGCALAGAGSRSESAQQHARRGAAAAGRFWEAPPLSGLSVASA